MKIYKTLVAKHSECVFYGFKDLNWLVSIKHHQKLEDAKNYLLCLKHDFGFQLIIDCEDIIRLHTFYRKGLPRIFSSYERIEIYKWLSKQGYIEYKGKNYGPA